MVRREKGNNEFDFVERDNYKIGTVLGVDLKFPEKVVYKETPMYRLIVAAIKSEIRRRIYDKKKGKTYELLRQKENLSEDEKGYLENYKKYFGEQPDHYMDYIRNNRTKKEVISEAYSRKLFLIANAEVVQGRDTTEQIKVSPDREIATCTTFENIWYYFEQQEELKNTPPKAWLYQPILIPIIGGGVANEGYTDLDIFSTLVDLYYKHLHENVESGKRIAIPQMIINIRNTTAIKHRTQADGSNRTIDIETAFWYLEYRNSVELPKQRDPRLCEEVGRI